MSMMYFHGVNLQERLRICTWAIGGGGQCEVQGITWVPVFAYVCARVYYMIQNSPLVRGKEGARLRHDHSWRMHLHF